jgi:F0F1-type ATP synthase membrane subunit b/b'
MEMFKESLPVLVNFAVVVAVMYFATRKAASQFLVTRSQTIGNQIAEGEKASAEAAVLLNEWEAKWKTSEAYAKQMFDEAKSTIERVRLSTVEKAKAESERVRREARLGADTEARRAMRLLEQEMSEKSLNLAQNFLNKNITDDDRKTLVTEYVEIVGNGHSG